MDTPELPALPAGGAQTKVGNLLEILDRGPQNRDEWTLLAALWAQASGRDNVEADIQEGLWLTTNTPMCPLPHADQSWPEPACEALWGAVERGCLNPLVPAAERTALAATLSLAFSPGANAAAVRVFDESRDPLVCALLVPVVSARAPLSGEPSLGRGRVRTSLLALSGLLFVVSAFRLIARVVLGLRRHATWALRPEGIALTQSTVLLGKQLGTVERLLPFDRVRAIRRETRYAGAALYAGLFALGLGSYLGTALIADGVRAPGGSTTLVGMGLAAIALGVLLDFVLFRYADVAGGAARVTIELDRGRPLVLAGPRVRDADAWVRRCGQLRGRV